MRPLDGGELKFARRFGETEDEALDALREAIEVNIGAVTKPPTPLGEPSIIPATEADLTILRAREGMKRFASLV